jgi:3-hydroxyisobutyrate dehydrogenase
MVQGAEARRTAGEAVANAEFVVLSLADDAAVREVVAQLAGGGRPALTAGQLVVDTSTIAPSTAIEMAGVLSALDVDYVDAPVSGGPSAAGSGSLTIMVGGADQVVRRAEPVLRSLGAHVVPAGCTGAGEALKLCCQGAVAVQMNMISQLVDVARLHGIPLAALQAALATSTAGNHMARTRFPVPGIVEGSPASDGWRPDFSGRLMAKDVLLTADFVTEQIRLDGLDSALAALIASVERGDGELDWSKAFA